MAELDDVHAVRTPHYLAKQHYPQEGRLLKATQKLYRYGNKPYTPKKVSFEGVEGAATAGINASKMSKLRAAAQRELDKQKEAREAATAARAPEEFVDREDVDFIKGRPWSAEQRSVAAGQSLPNQPRFFEEPPGINDDPYAQALENQKTNAAASDIRIGGVYTPQGLKKAAESASVEAEDRLRARALMGQRYQLDAGMYGR